jgi:hypothetical protein
MGGETTNPNSVLDLGGRFNNLAARLNHRAKQKRIPTEKRS